MSCVWVISGVVLGQIAIALGLIASQHPIDNPRGEGLDFKRLPKNLPKMPEQSFTARDGSQLPLRHFPCSDAPLLIMVHGSGWHGAQFATLAGKLAAASLAEVLVPDLRGHGEAPARRGDIDYFNQLEDDLEDLVERFHKGQKLVLLGHSSGGGLVIRVANGALKGRIDKAILLAPFLKHNAPTARSSSRWAAPLYRRIIGLSMLNFARFRWLNHLTAIQFRFPDTVVNGPLGDTTTCAYSYRMMRGFAPRAAYLQDIASLPDFTLIAGEQDEAFHANRYQKTMSQASDRGQYHLLSGIGHLDLVDAPEAYTLIAEALHEL